MESEATPSPNPTKPKRYWPALIFEYLLTLFVIGGLEAVCLMDWRSLFWAALLLAVLRLHSRFWAWLLPKRLHLLGLQIGMVVILMPLLFLHHVIWAYWLNPVRISKATTYITEPLTPDGSRVDFFAALERRVTPKSPLEENGFRMIVRALGPKVLGYNDEPLDQWKQKRWDELCEKMRLDPNNLDSICEFYSIDEWVKKDEESKNPMPDDSDERWKWRSRVYERDQNIRKHLHDRSARIDACPVALQWIQANNEIYDLFGKAVREPVFFTPFFRDRNYPSLYSMDQLSVSNAISRELKYRIRYFLENGETDRAWYDIMTCFHFTEHEIKNAFNSQAVFLAMATRPLRQVVDVLRQSDLSLETLQRYKNDVEPFLGPLDQTILENVKFGDRLFCLDFLLRNTYDPGWMGPTRIPRDLAWNQAAIDLNRRFEKEWFPPDRPYRPEHQHDWHRQEASRFKAARIIAWYLVRKGISKAFPSMMGDFILATQGNVCGCGFPHEPFDNRGIFVWGRFVRLAFALEEYRLKNGGYPEELISLREIDDRLDWADPFSDDRPFRYERRASTEYILYSVGPNGVDDRGVENFEDKKDDIAIQIP